MKMIDNGVDSLRNAMEAMRLSNHREENIELSYKRAIISLHHSFEVLFKYMLIQKDEGLIYKNSEKYYNKKFKLISSENKEELKILSALRLAFVEEQKSLPYTQVNDMYEDEENNIIARNTYNDGFMQNSLQKNENENENEDNTTIGIIEAYKKVVVIYKITNISEENFKNFKELNVLRNSLTHKSIDLDKEFVERILTVNLIDVVEKILFYNFEIAILMEAEYYQDFIKNMKVARELFKLKTLNELWNFYLQGQYMTKEEFKIKENLMSQRYGYQEGLVKYLLDESYKSFRYYEHVIINIQEKQEMMRLINYILDEVQKGIESFEDIEVLKAINFEIKESVSFLGSIISKMKWINEDTEKNKNKKNVEKIIENKIKKICHEISKVDTNEFSENIVIEFLKKSIDYRIDGKKEIIYNLESVSRFISQYIEQSKYIKDVNDIKGMEREHIDNLMCNILYRDNEEMKNLTDEVYSECLKLISGKINSILCYAERNNNISYKYDFPMDYINLFVLFECLNFYKLKDGYKGKDLNKSTLEIEEKLKNIYKESLESLDIEEVKIVKHCRAIDLKISIDKLEIEVIDGVESELQKQYYDGHYFIRAGFIELDESIRVVDIDNNSRVIYFTGGASCDVHTYYDEDKDGYCYKKFKMAIKEKYVKGKRILEEDMQIIVV